MPASQRHSSPSEDHEGPARKRVGKACDRCRLKKSKCNGLSPCLRCTADNAICVFGERRRVQDRVYPKGYVEMLEQQQAQLVAGLRELYHRLQPDSPVTGWPGGPIPDGSFEDDPEILRLKMLATQGISGSPKRMTSGCSTPPDSDDFPYSHSHSNSFDLRSCPPFPQKCDLDYTSPPFDVKPSPPKGKPGRPRQNKTGTRQHHPYRRPDGEPTQTRRRKNASVSSLSSAQDILEHKEQQQQQLSNGFQATMEQLPHIPGVLPYPSLGTSIGIVPSAENRIPAPPVVTSLPSTSATFQTDLLSSPISPTGMVSLASSHSSDFKLSSSSDSSSSSSSPGDQAEGHHLPSGSSSTKPGPAAVIPSTAAPAPSHRFGHHHGDSMSSISTIDSAMSDGDHMFDLGNASLDDTVSLFDPFVAADGIMTGEDDPLSSLGSFVSESMSGSTAATAGVAPSASAAAALTSGVGSLAGSGLLSPGLGVQQPFDFLTLRQSGIIS